MLKLAEINNKLIEADESLATELTKLFPLEQQYTSRYNELMLHSGMGNQASREAEALETLRLEPIFDEYHEEKLKVKILYNRLDTLKEISKNMRNLAFNNE